MGVPTDTESRPLLVFDGSCGFCRRSVERWRRSTRDTIDYVPFQQLADPFAGVPRRHFTQSVHLIYPSGEVYFGAHAVFKALNDGARKRWPLWLYRKVPGAAPIAEFAYRRVANNRGLASKLAAVFWRERPGS